MIILWRKTKVTLKKFIVARNPYSRFRTKKWNVHRRRNSHTIPGTAIGFSYTDKDRSLIPGMLKSFYFAEYVISYYDDNKNATFEFNESERHKSIIRKARQSGAKYFWGVGPKRRLSKEAIQTIRNNMHHVEEGKILMTDYRFFWGKDLNRVRTDGMWGRRKTSAFFPILKSNKYGNKPLHHRWHPKGLSKVYVDAGQYYIGRHTKDVLERKLKFYKSRDYQTTFWKEATIETLITDKVSSEPVYEKVIGIGRREKRFEG